MGEANFYYFTCLKLHSETRLDSGRYHIYQKKNNKKQKFLNTMASNDFKEVLPKTGLLHHEATYNFVLCKPKIMPLKSITLEKLEKMQKEAQELVRDQDGPSGDPRLEDFMPRKAGDGSSD